jgi:hypothetical protein
MSIGFSFNITPSWKGIPQRRRCSLVSSAESWRQQLAVASAEACRASHQETLSRARSNRLESEPRPSGSSCIRRGYSQEGHKGSAWRKQSPICQPFQTDNFCCLLFFSLSIRYFTTTPIVDYRLLITGDCPMSRSHFLSRDVPMDAWVDRYEKSHQNPINRAFR